MERLLGDRGDHTTGTRGAFAAAEAPVVSHETARRQENPTTTLVSPTPHLPNPPQIFAPDSGIKLQPHQRINHFPNHVELTRKDLLVKNWRRYRKAREQNEAKQPHARTAQTDFAPSSPHLTAAPTQPRSDGVSLTPLRTP